MDHAFRSAPRSFLPVRPRPAHSAEVRSLRPPRRQGEPGLSAESLKALYAPTIILAKEVFDLRMSRPMTHLTPADVWNNDEVVFALGVAETIGEVTGVMAGERTKAEALGRREAEGEKRKQPRVVGDTVTAPGAVDVRGGVIARRPA